MVINMKDLSYEERLRKLDLPTLAYRRARGNQIETYKILTQKYDQECVEGIFRVREDSITRGNTKKLFKTRARLDIRKFSFPNRVVENWNGLPEWVVNADSVSQFEGRLDRFWHTQELRFNYKARHINTTTRSVHTAGPVRDEAPELETQA